MVSNELQRSEETRYDAFKIDRVSMWIWEVYVLDVTNSF